MWNKDEIIGKQKQLMGAINIRAAEFITDPNLASEGEDDQLEGRVQETVGRAHRKADEATHAAAEATTAADEASMAASEASRAIVNCQTSLTSNLEACPGVTDSDPLASECRRASSCARRWDGVREGFQCVYALDYGTAASTSQNTSLPAPL